MVLLHKDGITVQALSPQEEAEYKRLGFKLVKAELKPAPESEPVSEKPAKGKPAKVAPAPKEGEL